MAPRGIEVQTPQAFRGLPIARRPDHHFRREIRPRAPRPARLIDEAEQPAFDVTPADWPIGIGRDLPGTQGLL
jgi:peptide chain release factor 3